MKEEALKLAEQLEEDAKYGECDWTNPKVSADMIRRLVQHIEELEGYKEKSDTYMELMDVHAKELDRAIELLHRCETEMRYAGWTKFESDNTARNGVYEQVKEFLR